MDKAGLDPKFFAWPPEAEPGRAPYRGLKPLEAEDAGIFFGREAPIVEAIDRLRELAEAAPPRLLVILGASGSGKSSFLRAGLLPRLRRDDAQFLPLLPIRPERAALTGENGLVRALEAAMPARSREELRRLVDEGANAVKPLLATLVRAAFQRTLSEEAAARSPAVVIAIDQAEELFRPAGAEGSAALLSLLRDLAIGSDPAVIVIFAIRSDAYDALEHAKPLEGLRQATLPLLPMPRSAYKDVIEGPARRHVEAGNRLEIEPQLTQRLLADIDAGGGSDALPLLALTLEQLFFEFSAHTLRLADYHAFGGLRGAIDAVVKRAFVRADADPRISKDHAVRATLLRRGFVPWLAGIDPISKSPRRNIARAADVPAEAAPLIELLVEERLLTADTKLETDTSTGQEARIKTIEPGHEALLRQWGLLQGWLAEDFGLLATLESVNRAARDWDANARAEAWLAHQGQRLLEAQMLDARPDIAAKLDMDDRAYLTACSEKENAIRVAADNRRREREAEEARKLADAQALASANKRTTQRTMIGLAVALAFAIVAGSFGIMAQRQRIVAEHNLSSALAALSPVAVQTNPVRAAKLALAAWPRDGDDASAVKLGVALNALAEAAAQLRERKAFRGHKDFVHTAAFSTDGKRLVTASKDHAALVWDTATGAPISRLQGHEADVTSATFSPAGSRVVTSSDDGTARIWDAKTGKSIIVLSGHKARVNHAIFSPDGTRVVTASNDTTARVWDSATGGLIATLVGHGQYVRSVAFSPDGARVLTASWDNKAIIWDARTGKQTVILQGHEGSVESAVFSPDGTRIITASNDKTARLWNVNGEQIAVLAGHQNPVLSVAFSPDGKRVATASADHTARLWDGATGKPISILRGHENYVYNVRFSPDSTRLVTASFDATARVWDATGEPPPAEVLRYYGLVAREPVAVLRGHKGAVHDAIFSFDGDRVATASDDMTARLWDIALGRPVALLRGHQGAINKATFSPDGSRLVTASEDMTAIIWDAATAKPIKELRGHSAAVNGAVFSPDGARVATASADSTASIWDVVTGNELTLTGHSANVTSAAFSPDGARAITSSLDRTARLWNAATGEEIAALKGHDGPVQSAAFSPNGAFVITASADATVRIWDAAARKTIAVLRGHDGSVSTAIFSPDGTLILSGSRDKTARLWDAVTGKALAIFSGHEADIYSATFAPDGTRVMTASNDGTVRIWDVATAAPILVLRGHSAAVMSAAFARDGLRALTASADKTARLWDISGIPKGNLFDIVCKWLPDTDLADIGRDYALADLKPICQGRPPLPERVPH